MRTRMRRFEFSIPEEIVFQILEGLPVKSLLRFRAVSKPWRSMIDDPLFVKSHEMRSYTRPRGIRLISECIQYSKRGISLYKLCPTDTEGGSSSTPILTVKPSDKTIASNHLDSLQAVHGLVYNNGVVYNPSTGESIALPPINMVEKEKCYFLGFDSSTDTYKVVNFSRIVSRNPMAARTEVKVLTLGTNSWRKIHDLPDEFRRLVIRHDMGICVDDVIYCSASDHKFDYDEVSGGYILAFEVGSEKVSLIPNPTTYTYMVNVGKHLALVMSELEVEDDEDESDDGYLEETIEFCILKDYKEIIWDEQTVLCPALQIMRNNIADIDIKVKYTQSKPMGTIHTNEVLFYSEGFSSDFSGDERARCCFYLDLKTSDFRHAPKLSESPEESDMKQPYTKFLKYAESLLSLKGLPAE